LGDEGTDREDFSKIKNRGRRLEGGSKRRNEDEASKVKTTNQDKNSLVKCTVSQASNYTRSKATNPQIKVDENEEYKRDTIDDLTIEAGRLCKRIAKTTRKEEGKGKSKNQRCFSRRRSNRRNSCC